MVMTLLLLAALPGSVAEGRVLKTQAEALAGVFPPPLAVTRQTVFLTDTQRDAATALAGRGVDPSRKMVVVYTATDTSNGAVAVRGYAYFDTHKVRTLQETVLVLVRPDGRLGLVEVLSFLEPPDYLPPKPWLDHLRDRPLDDNLTAGRGIRNMTGATLTTRAITRAIRRVLAVHRVVFSEEGAEAEQ